VVENREAKPQSKRAVLAELYENNEDPMENPTPLTKEAKRKKIP